MVVMIYVAEDISFVCRLAQVLDEMRAKSWSSLNVTAHERATEDQTDMLQDSYVSYSGIPFFPDACSASHFSDACSASHLSDDCSASHFSDACSAS